MMLATVAVMEERADASQGLELDRRAVSACAQHHTGAGERERESGESEDGRGRESIFEVWEGACVCTRVHARVCTHACVPLRAFRLNALPLRLSDSRRGLGYDGNVSRLPQDSPRGPKVDKMSYDFVCMTWHEHGMGLRAAACGGTCVRGQGWRRPSFGCWLGEYSGTKPQEGG